MTRETEGARQTHEPLIRMLEDEMRRRIQRVIAIDKGLEAMIQHLPDELEAVGHVNKVGGMSGAIEEMQKGLTQKKALIETRLNEIQQEMDLLSRMKEKASQEDVTSEVQALVSRVAEKQATITVVIKAMNELMRFARSSTFTRVGPQSGIRHRTLDASLKDMHDTAHEET